MKTLNIFLVIPNSSTGHIGDSLIWYRNLYEPLIDLGHTVELFSIDQNSNNKLLHKWNKKDRTEFSDKLLRAINKSNNQKKIDVFFSYLYDVHIDIQVIKLVKQKGILTINFSCNNTHQFYLQKEIAKIYDLNLFSEKKSKEKFDEINASSKWFQMAANPRYYRRLNSKETYEISFVGQNYSNRSYYLNRLLLSGLDVKIFGYGWKKKVDYQFLRENYNRLKTVISLGNYLLSTNSEKKYQILANLKWKEFNNYFSDKWQRYIMGPLDDEEIIKTFSNSKINLGFSEVYINHDYSEIKQIHLHLRDFEIPMTGGFYITQYSDELTEFYDPDNEVVVYNSEYELLEKVKYYLNNTNLRETIKNAGHKRAQSCHSYQKRFDDLFKAIDLH